MEEDKNIVSVEDRRSISGELLPPAWPKILNKEDEHKVYLSLYDSGDDRNSPPTKPHIDHLSYKLENGNKRLRYFAVRHQRNISGIDDPNMNQYDVLEEKFNESPPDLVLYEGFVDDINHTLTREMAIQLGEPAFMAYLVQQHNVNLKDGDTPIVIESADQAVNDKPDEIRDLEIIKNIAEKFKKFDKIDIVMGSGHAIREKEALEQFFEKK